MSSDCVKAGEKCSPLLKEAGVIYLRVSQRRHSLFPGMTSGDIEALVEAEVTFLCCLSLITFKRKIQF